ncbi:hypothetical protein D3C73_1543680 [compost metagenome]
MGNISSRKWDDREYTLLFDFLLKSCNIDIGHSTLNNDGLVTTFLVDENGEHLTRKLFGE